MAYQPKIKDCPVCGVTFQAGTKTCSPECSEVRARELRKTKPHTCVCGECGEKFKSKKKSQTFCSCQCFYESMRENKEEQCLRCSKAFMPKNIKNNTFCSRACSFRLQRYKAKATKRKEKKQKERVSLKDIRSLIYIKTCIECYLVFVAAHKNEICCGEVCKKKRQINSFRRTAFGQQRSCVECGNTFMYNRNIKTRKWCSDECEEIWKKRQKKENSKKGHHTRRARIKGLPFERFLAVEIFKRDNYKCQSCGRKTRPDYKTTHDLYPNLDHIIPIAKGGGHTRKNTQCLCRACNIEKGAGALHDQLLLVG